MRKLIYHVASSVDSFIARSDGGVDWLEPPRKASKEDYGMKEFFSGIDTVLLGRKTYDFMLSMNMDHYPGVANYVFSRTLPAGKRGDVTFVSEDAPGFVVALKQQAGKDIWLVGGSSLAQELLQHKLVDEITIHYCPILLGAGIPLFQGPYPEVKLRFLRSKSYKSGFVGTSYAIE